ncbi:hypothetical protein [Actinomadura rugatobispora]|uniref:Uncharacterized protein n=1 Tax=Actinomadura rugatobispora TaxID=1994 RepID=A0ABW0ZP69_9ACTN|nr:hypothetical protein GCM10010200_093530 [Actinomadura rugatobispora]
MPRPRLAPGVDIVAAHGHPLAVRTPDGEFLRLNTSPEAAARLLELLGTPVNDEVPSNGDGPQRARPEESEEVQRLLDAFAEAGYLDAPPSWPSHRSDVLVLGDERLTSPLVDFLSSAGACPRPATPQEVAALAGTPAPGGQRSRRRERGPAAVVWCLDRPVPPGLWEEADRLPERGIAWARCHREGRQVWIEPIAAAPGDVLSAHVAARRLAATPAHHELAAYWAGAAANGGHPVTGPAQAAAIAALLAADLAAWAHGSTPREGRTPPRRRLRRLDLRDLTTTEHCVLPVPRVAPISGRRA